MQQQQHGAQASTPPESERKEVAALTYFNRAKPRWPQVEENLLFRIVRAAYTAGWNDKN